MSSFLRPSWTVNHIRYYMTVLSTPSLQRSRLGLMSQINRIGLLTRSLTGAEMSLVSELSWIIACAKETLLSQDTEEILELTDLLLKYRLWVFPKMLAYRF